MKVVFAALLFLSAFSAASALEQFEAKNCSDFASTLLPQTAWGWSWNDIKFYYDVDSLKGRVAEIEYSNTALEFEELNEFDESTCAKKYCDAAQLAIEAMKRLNALNTGYEILPAEKKMSAEAIDNRIKEEKVLKEDGSIEIEMNLTFLALEDGSYQTFTANASNIAGIRVWSGGKNISFHLELQDSEGRFVAKSSPVATKELYAETLFDLGADLKFGKEYRIAWRIDSPGVEAVPTIGHTSSSIAGYYSENPGTDLAFVIYAKKPANEVLLSEFTAYLKEDGFSEDFRKDFGETMSGMFFETPLWFYNAGNPKTAQLSKLFPADISFEPAEIKEPGLYKVKIKNFEQMFDSNGEPLGEVAIEFERLGEEKLKDNVLLHLPLDGYLGLNDGTRKGYGTANTSLQSVTVHFEDKTKSVAVQLFSTREKLEALKALDVQVLRSADRRAIELKAIDSNELLLFVPQSVLAGARENLSLGEVFQEKNNCVQAANPERLLLLKEPNLQERKRKFFLIPINFPAGEELDFSQQQKSQFLEITGLPAENVEIISAKSMECGFSGEEENVLRENGFGSPEGWKTVSQRLEECAHGLGIMLEFNPNSDYLVALIGKKYHKEMVSLGLSNYKANVIALNAGGNNQIIQEALAHEFAHTLGLCDEYSFLNWGIENMRWGCPNPYPGCCRDSLKFGQEIEAFEENNVALQCIPLEKKQQALFDEALSCAGMPCEPENALHCRSIMGGLRMNLILPYSPANDFAQKYFNGSLERRLLVEWRK